VQSHVVAGPAATKPALVGPETAQYFQRRTESHYAYYGMAGNFRSLQTVHRAVERYWHKMLCSRSWARRITWDMFHQIKQRQPILRPKLYLPYRELQALAVL
jgi:RNA-directed DNA polymerase